MNDFENEDALDDFEVEITDLDTDREKSRMSVLWLHGQRLLSQIRLGMTVLVVVGITLLILTLPSPSLSQFPQGSQKAPDTPENLALPQEITCSSFSVTILVASSTDNGTMHWYQGTGSSDVVVQTTPTSCTQPINIQMVPGSNGTGSWNIKK